MHILSTLPADGSDVEQAVDLAQTPGDIVFLSAADTDLACLAAGRARLPDTAPTLRLASILQLGHPLSVDLHVDRVVTQAKLVVVRLLGGRGAPAPALRPTRTRWFRSGHRRRADSPGRAAG